MFEFFKKKKEDIPPDVGKEAISTEIPEPEQTDFENDDIEEDIGKSGKKKGKGKLKSESYSASSERTMLEFEKVFSRLESMNELIKGYNERMGALSQQVGELRGMNISNEKAISKIEVESARAIDIVSEVEPEKLRIDFQKVEMKVEALSEKIESNKQFMDVVMRELKEIRSKMGTFLGTAELIKLNQDVKSELLGAQQMATKSRMYSDKTEQLFSEMKRGVAESQKIHELVKMLDANYSGMVKEVEKFKVDFSNIVNQNDFNDFKKRIGERFVNFEMILNSVERLRDENERLGRIIETILGISQQNKRDIADLAISIGDDHIKKVSDYDNRLNSILGILDALAGQITEIKAKVGIKGKISVKARKMIDNDNKLKLQNLEVNPKVSKPLETSQPEVHENVKRIQDNSGKGNEQIEQSLKEIEVARAADKSSAEIEADITYNSAKAKNEEESKIIKKPLEKHFHKKFSYKQEHKSPEVREHKNIANKKIKGNKNEQKAKKPNKGVVEFIREARKRGFDDYEIKEPLLKQGWPIEEVEKSFAYLKPKFEYKNIANKKNIIHHHKHKPKHALPEIKHKEKKQGVHLAKKNKESNHSKLGGIL